MSDSDLKDFQAVRDVFIRLGRSAAPAGKNLSGLAQVMLRISNSTKGVNKDNIRPRQKNTQEDETVNIIEPRETRRIRINKNRKNQALDRLIEEAYAAGHEEGEKTGHEQGYQEATERTTPNRVSTASRAFTPAHSNDPGQHDSIVAQYTYTFYIDRDVLIRSTILRYRVRKNSGMQGSILTNTEKVGYVEITDELLRRQPRERLRDIIASAIYDMVMQAILYIEPNSFIDQFTEYAIASSWLPTVIYDPGQHSPESMTNVATDITLEAREQVYERLGHRREDGEPTPPQFTNPGVMR